MGFAVREIKEAQGVRQGGVMGKLETNPISQDALGSTGSCQPRHLRWIPVNFIMGLVCSPSGAIQRYDRLAYSTYTRQP